MGVGSEALGLYCRQSAPHFPIAVGIPTSSLEANSQTNPPNPPLPLPVCCRSKDVIEPVLKPQWWVNCQGMAAEACDAVRDGRLEIIPKDFEATWFR